MYRGVFSSLAACLVVRRVSHSVGSRLKSQRQGIYHYISVHKSKIQQRTEASAKTFQETPLRSSAFLFLCLCFVRRRLSMEKTFFLLSVCAVDWWSLGSIEELCLLIFSVFKWKTAVWSDCCLKFQYHRSLSVVSALLPVCLGCFLNCMSSGQTGLTLLVPRPSVSLPRPWKLTKAAGSHSEYPGPL